MKPLISIIVPVYKAEKYLKACVDTILTQTYDNLEIILVDDGSPDNCPEICDKIALSDNRVKVFHKSNGGASSARNLGLDNASGEYICFVDSDDLLFPESVSDLFNSIYTHNSQYAAGGCIEKASDYCSSDKPDIVIDFSKSPFQLLRYISKAGSYSPYAKIFKTSIIKDNNLRYDENLKCSEDALFIRQYLRFCSRVSLTTKIVYLYNTDNVNSLSKKGYTEYYLYYIKKLNALKELVAILPLTDDQRSNFLSDRAVHGLYISISHYFLNWKDKKIIKEYVSSSLSAFEEWIDKDRTTPNISKAELKWWHKYKDFLFTKQINQIFNKLYFYYFLKNCKRNVKQLLVKLFHK